MRLLFHAVLIFGFFIGGDLMLNQGRWTRDLNTEVLQISKTFKRQVNRLVD